MAKNAAAQQTLTSEQPATSARKKPEREPIPTDPAQFEIRHVARLVGHVERAWAQVPKELQELYRPLFLKPFVTKPRADLVEVKP
jgi:hypothetical protein